MRPRQCLSVLLRLYWSTAVRFMLSLQHFGLIDCLDGCSDMRSGVGELKMDQVRRLPLITCFCTFPVATMHNELRATGKNHLFQCRCLQRPLGEL